MKKIFIICAIGLLPLVALADQNPIKMTTFFPAPYAAFSRLNALNTGAGFDTNEGLVVGLSSSPNCKLSLGCNEVSSNPLDTPQTVVSSGDLYLNGEDGKLVIEATDAITVGSSSSQYGEKKLQFKKNAHIGTFFNLISANFGTANINTLKIGNMAFPSCKAASGASGQGKMQWQELTLQVDGQSANSRKGYFLTCGSGTPCDPNCFKWVWSQEDALGPETSCTHIQCSAAYDLWQGKPCENLGEVQGNMRCCEGTGQSAMLFLYEVTCEKACDCGGNGGGSGGGSIGVVPGSDDN